MRVMDEAGLDSPDVNLWTTALAATNVQQRTWMLIQ